jgi:hypothetical protein
LPPPSESFDIKSNKCEICNQIATAGIIDELTPNKKLRYTCQNHYMAIHDRIVQEKTLKKAQNDDSKK